jgi:protein arginine N-methyltransferase 1
VIEEHSDLIRDKIVLDVGCGTGLLSCFCAQVGAKKGKLSLSHKKTFSLSQKRNLIEYFQRSLLFYDVVYAIEASEMANAAELVVAQNSLSHVIEVFHNKVENVELPVNKVDVIISEWMGVFLLYVSSASKHSIHFHTRTE